MNFIVDFYNFLLVPNQEITIILSIPLTLFKSYLNVMIFEHLFKLNFSLKRISIFIISDVFTSLLVYNILPFPYGRIFSILITVFLYIVILKQSFTRSIVIQSISLGLIVVNEMLFSNILCNVFNISKYGNCLSIPIYKISMLFCICISTFIFYCILDNKKITIKAENFLEINSSVIISVISILLALVYQTFKNVVFNDSIPYHFFIFDIIILAFYFIAIINNIINLSKINQSNLQIKNLELYNKTLALMQDNIRAFKHDFSNIMQAIGGYLMLDNFDGLKKYYSDLLKDCNSINNLDSLNPELINNPAIFNILANKYYLSTQYNIKMNISVFIDMNSLNIKTYELSRILGILLDNAIEAAKDCDNKDISISFSKDSKFNRNLITIENSYSDGNIDLNKIFEKGFSSKKEHTGLGLWEVRKILNQNNNLNLYTSKTEKFFKQQLEIYGAC